MDDYQLLYPDKLIEDIKINSALRDRKIYFNEEVTRNSVFKVVHLLDRLVTLDKQQNRGKKDIEIVLDCEGGNGYFGLSLCSKMMELRDKGYKIITTTNSIAMSMGFLFLVCGSCRRAQRYATVMVHQPLSGTEGKLQDMQEDVKETDRLWNIYKKIVIENTKITDEQLKEKKKCKEDWYMNPETALELGVIDEII